MRRWLLTRRPGAVTLPHFMISTRVVFFTLGAMAMTAAAVQATERKDIPEKYKWNLADLYPSEAAWTHAKDDPGKANPGARQVPWAARQVPEGPAGGPPDAVRHGPRAVAAGRLRQHPVRRGRAGGPAARDEAVGRAARHHLLGGGFLGPAGDPHAGHRQGAQLDHGRTEARALPHVSGGHAAPEAPHAGGPRREDCRRSGRARTGGRRGPRRAVERRPPLPHHQAVDR